jgi:hypothetical protein
MGELLLAARRAGVRLNIGMIRDIETPKLSQPVKTLSNIQGSHRLVIAVDCDNYWPHDWLHHCFFQSVIHANSPWISCKRESRRSCWAVSQQVLMHRVNRRLKKGSDLDLAKYRAVSIWCKRFSVNFGAAPKTDTDVTKLS